MSTIHTWFSRKQTIIIKIWKKSSDFLISLIFPKICLECEVNGFSLCPQCAKKIRLLKTTICIYCGKISPRGKICSSCRGKSCLTGIIIGVKYSGTIKEVIHSFKYEGNRDLLPPLGNILVNKLDETRISGDKIITFVPLHKKKENIRGFNQSELLARYLANKTSNKCKKLLIRTKFTKPQIGLTKEGRKNNLEKAFRAIDKNMKGKTIILIDDVCTTGATLEECARQLRIAGARQIWGLVIAHGN